MKTPVMLMLNERRTRTEYWCGCDIVTRALRVRLGIASMHTSTSTYVYWRSKVQWQINCKYSQSDWALLAGCEQVWGWSWLGHFFMQCIGLHRRNGGRMTINRRALMQFSLEFVSFSHYFDATKGMRISTSMPPLVAVGWFLVGSLLVAGSTKTSNNEVRRRGRSVQTFNERLWNKKRPSEVWKSQCSARADKHQPRRQNSIFIPNISRKWSLRQHFADVCVYYLEPAIFAAISANDKSATVADWQLKQPSS